MRKEQGFSLIELLIAVAIVGLLVMVALPSYQNSIRKANRSDAQITLSRFATLQEQYFFRNNRYTVNFGDLIEGAAGVGSIDSDEGHYFIILSMPGGPSAGWTMIATAQGDQAADTECYTMTLTSLGNKTSADIGSNPTTGCW